MTDHKENLAKTLVDALSLLVDGKETALGAIYSKMLEQKDVILERANRAVGPEEAAKLIAKVTGDLTNLLSTHAKAVEIGSDFAAEHSLDTVPDPLRIKSLPEFHHEKDHTLEACGLPNDVENLVYDYQDKAKRFMSSRDPDGTFIREVSFLIFSTLRYIETQGAPPILAMTSCEVNSKVIEKIEEAIMGYMQSPKDEKERKLRLIEVVILPLLLRELFSPLKSEEASGGKIPVTSVN